MAKWSRPSRVNKVKPYKDKVDTDTLRASDDHAMEDGIGEESIQPGENTEQKNEVTPVVRGADLPESSRGAPATAHAEISILDEQEAARLPIDPPIAFIGQQIGKRAIRTCPFTSGKRETFLLTSLGYGTEDNATTYTGLRIIVFAALIAIMGINLQDRPAILFSLLPFAIFCCWTGPDFDPIRCCQRILCRRLDHHVHE